ncbi:bactericidal permeability-increasing protein-like [Pelobates fuscus]|uniref:bactericidal permeability-increasing protein-like n=1 Tax=Pelobates fuscus TaxID=191477 RepID=UPI002FE499BB
MCLRRAVIPRNDSGSFNLLLSGVYLTAQVNTFKDSSGRPSVLLSACQSVVKNAKLHLSGGASWFYNLFAGFLEEPIKHNVNEKLCPRVNEALAILQRELDTFQVISQLDAKNEIDYSLVHPPRVEKTHIDLELKGSVHPVGSSRNDLFPEIHINLPNERTSMVYIGLSEYFFNSIGKNYFTMNTLKLVLTHEQFPHAFWLRTGDYGTIIPKIKHHYPQSQAMELVITATKAPMVTVTPQNITMEMTGLLQGMVVLPYLVTSQVFSVNMVATLIADKVQLSGLNLVVSFVVERYKFHEFKSSVGYINVAELESALDHSLRESVLREINDRLQKGIPMPALGNISLQDPAVTITQASINVRP